jgi:hypothetical protein
MDRSRTHAPWPVLVEARRSGLLVDGRHIDGATILSAAVSDDPPTVYFKRGFLRRDVELRFPEMSDATRFVEATRFDPSRRVASLVIRPILAKIGCASLSLAFVGYWLLSLVIEAAGGRGFSGALVALGVVVLAVIGFCTRGRMRVGTDGIEISRALLPRRWVRYADLENIATVQSGLEPLTGVAGRDIALHLRSGKLVRVRLEADHANDAAIQRIEDAIAQRRDRISFDDAVLRRRARPVADWIRELRAIARGANADHRRAVVPLERLLAALEDTEQTAEVRAAAAVAVAASEDDGARVRLRVLADMTIDPKLRFAFRSALASDEPAAVEAALAEIDDDDDDESTARRRV